jgi:hypothetical protein
MSHKSSGPTNENQTVGWNTSTDGSGHYNDGPSPGSYNQPSHTPANGYNNTTPSSTPVNSPGGTDYTEWNWEQVLAGVLGIQIPDRDQVTSFRWTATDSNDEGGSLFEIFGYSGGYHTVAGEVVVPGSGGSFYAYLNPALQDSGGPWDEFYNAPVQLFSQMLSTSPPNYMSVAVDPRTFGSAEWAFSDAQEFYQDATETFNSVGSGLQSEASQFQGDAGQAFYNLIDHLYDATQTISAQIGRFSPAQPNSYAQLIAGAAVNTINFVNGIWQTMGAWQERLDHSPLGAIYQALLDGNVVSGSPGNYYIPNVLDAGTYGDLLTDSTWYNIEGDAKKLWLASIQQTLDTHALSLVSTLVDSYMNTAAQVRSVTAATLAQIGPLPNESLNPNNLNTGAFNIFDNPCIVIGGGNGFPNPNNLNAGNILFNPCILIGGGNGLPNTFGPGPNFGSGGFNFGGLNLGGLNLGGLNLSGLGGPNNISGLGGPNNISGFGGPNKIGGTGGGLNSPAVLASTGGLGGGGGLNGTGGLGGTGGLNGVGGLNGLGSGTGGNVVPGDLRTALDDSNAEQAALNKALLLAPSSGPLHNALEQALGDNAMVQGALRSAIAGATPPGTALQAALNDNGGVLSALNSALGSGQVPPNGPLRTALQQASGDNASTKAALRNALGSALPGGKLVHTALVDNGKVQSALKHMLASGLLPRSGPLHTAIRSALAKSQETQHELDQALAGKGRLSQNAIQHALADNRAVQHDLTAALASGEVPATGPLRADLQAALAGSRNLSTALRQALTSAGVPAEPVQVVPGLGLPAGPSLLSQPGGSALHALLGGGGLGGTSGGGLGGLGGTSGGGLGGLGGALTGGIGKSAVAGPAASSGLTGLTGSSGLSGLTGGGSAAPVSSGRFVAPGATDQAVPPSTAAGTSGVPFYPPMAGSGMGMGGQQAGQERERTTWLAEDEDVWGTDPTVGPASIGRDFDDLDEDNDSYDDFVSPATRSRRPQYRQDAH